MRQLILVSAAAAAVESCVQFVERLDRSWWVLDLEAISAGWPPSAGIQPLEGLIAASSEDLVVVVASDSPWAAQAHEVLGRWDPAFRAITVPPGSVESLAVALAAAVTVGESGRRGLVEVDVVTAREVVARALATAGVAEVDAAAVAHDLVDAETSGHPSHGLMRTREYLTKLRDGIYRADGQPSHVVLDANRAQVDGGCSLGPVVSRYVFDEVIAPCSEPVQLIGLRRGGHLGRLTGLGRAVAGLDRAILGFVNGGGGGQKVVPFGGSEPRLATNPLLFACPMPGDAPLIVDLCTSAWSDGEVQRATVDGRVLPAGVLQDHRGHPVYRATTYAARPQRAFLTPLGGSEAHKGFALAMAVEVLAGVIGSPDHVRPGRLSYGNSALFIVMRLDALGRHGGEVLEDLGRMAAYINSCPPADAKRPVRLPGVGSAALDAVIRVEAELWEDLLQSGQRGGAPATS